MFALGQLGEERLEYALLNFLLLFVLSLNLRINRALGFVSLGGFSTCRVPTLAGLDLLILVIRQLVHLFMLHAGPLQQQLPLHLVLLFAELLPL